MGYAATKHPEQTVDELSVSIAEAAHANVTEAEISAEVVRLSAERKPLEDAMNRVTDAMESRRQTVSFEAALVNHRQSTENAIKALRDNLDEISVIYSAFCESLEAAIAERNKTIAMIDAALQVGEENQKMVVAKPARKRRKPAAKQQAAD